MIKKIFNYMRVPAILYFSTMLLGIIVGLFIISPSIGEKVVNFSAIKLQFFYEILINNCGIILAVYLSVIFSKKYVYFVYCFNGLMLGIVTGWIFKSNVMLLLLIIPHGIFEIPNILATGYIAAKGENFVRNNFSKYIKIFLCHELFTVFCAIIETFITPFFQQFV